MILNIPFFNALTWYRG